MLFSAKEHAVVQPESYYSYQIQTSMNIIQGAS
jgi:hypothetical protein